MPELINKGELNEIRTQLDEFRKESRRIARAAAKRAQDTSREVWESRFDKRPRGMPMNTRVSTHGKFGSHIRWRAKTTDDGNLVRLDVDTLDAHTRAPKAKAPYWVIQEIGTGQSATMHEVLSDGSVDSTPYAVQSQVGREISRHLQFSATGKAGGPLAPPEPGARKSQLFPLGSLQWERVYGMPNPRVIQREIQGKHFARRGAEEGFSFYRNAMESLARDTFRS